MSSHLFQTRQTWALKIFFSPPPFYTQPKTPPKNVCNQNGARGRNSRIVCKHAGEDLTEITTPTNQGGKTTIVDNSGTSFILMSTCPNGTAVLGKDKCAKNY